MLKKYWHGLAGLAGLVGWLGAERSGAKFVKTF